MGPTQGVLRNSPLGDKFFSCSALLRSSNIPHIIGHNFTAIVPWNFIWYDQGLTNLFRLHCFPWIFLYQCPFPGETIYFHYYGFRQINPQGRSYCFFFYGFQKTELFPKSLCSNSSVRTFLYDNTHGFHRSSILTHNQLISESLSARGNLKVPLE